MKLVDLLRKKHSLAPDVPVAISASMTKKVKIDKSQRDIVVLATSLDVDIVKEVVLPTGADTDYFLGDKQRGIPGNRKVFVDHNTDLKNNVGAVRSASLYPSNDELATAWKCRVHMYALASSQTPEDILYIAENFGIGVSVGINPTDWGKCTPDEVRTYSQGSHVPRTIVRKWRWLELSFTAHPANVACTSQGEEADNKKCLDAVWAQYDELVTKSLIKRESAHMLGAPITAKRKFVAVYEPERRPKFKAVVS